MQAAASSNPLAPLANQLRRAGCQIRQLNPDLFDSFYTPPLGSPIPNRSANRQIWDNICREFPVTNPDPQGFNGGQCATTYNILGNVLLVGATTPASQLIQAVGPLQGIRWRINPQAGGSFQYLLEVINASGQLISNSVFTGSNPIANYWFTVARTDGQPDNCGDTIPPPIIPPVPPQNSYNLNLNIGGVQINAPVTLEDYDFTEWPDFVFSPTFSLGGINFGFTLEGISIDFGGDIPFVDIPTGGETDLNPVLQRIDEAEIGINTSLSEVESNLSGLLNQVLTQLGTLEELIQCCSCEENIAFSIEPIVVESPGGVYAVPANTIALRFELKLPATAGTRIQFGSANAPNVFYWGWYSAAFLSGDQSDRSELHYAIQTVPVMKGTKTVTFNPVKGNIGNVLAIVKIPCIAPPPEE